MCDDAYTYVEMDVTQRSGYLKGGMKSDHVNSIVNRRKKEGKSKRRKDLFVCELWLYCITQ